MSLQESPSSRRNEQWVKTPIRQHRPETKSPSRLPSQLAALRAIVEAQVCFGPVADILVSPNRPPSIDAVSISAGRSGTVTTKMREVGPPAVDTSRIIALEQIAKNATVGVSPDDIAIQLAKLSFT